MTVQDLIDELTALPSTMKLLDIYVEYNDQYYVNIGRIRDGKSLVDPIVVIEVIRDLAAENDE